MNSILEYFPELSSHQQQQFDQLGPLYKDWNSKINLISRKDIDHLYERHILHSLAIAKVISFKKKTRILDVGTGGGFPGIPLAILFPNAHFHLVDSIGKKIKVVEAIALEVGLDNVSSEQARAENLEGKYDFIVSRAVTSLPLFISWVKKRIGNKNNNAIPNGILYLKGGNVSEELMSVNLNKKIYSISDWFEGEFFETKKLVHLYL